MDESPINPYAPPQTDQATLSGDYFCVDPRAMRMGEMWRCSPNVLQFYVLLMIKAIRLPTMVVFAHGLEGIPCDPATLPNDIRTALEPRAAELLAAGFRYLGTSMNPVVGAGQLMASAFLNADRSVAAVLVYVRVLRTVQVLCSLHSQCDDGSLAITKDHRADTDPQPGTYVAYVARGSVQALQAEHQEQLQRRQRQAIVHPSEEAAEAWLKEWGKQSMKHLIERGLLRPITAAELQSLLARYPQSQPTLPAAKSSVWSISWKTALLFLCGLIVYLVLIMLSDLAAEPLPQYLKWIALLLVILLVTNLLLREKLRF
jgi:hypothetical protein